LKELGERYKQMSKEQKAKLEEKKTDQAIKRNE